MSKRDRPPRGYKTPPKFHAVHEAGHAVIVWILARRADEPEPGFSRIDLRSREEAITRAGGRVGGVHGVTDYRPFREYVPDNAGPSDATKSRLRRDMERAVTILLAGPAAEARFTHRGFAHVALRDIGGHGDRQRAEELAGDFAKTPAGRDELIEQLLARTRVLLSQTAVWPTINALADALLEEGALTGNQALKIMRKAWHKHGRNPLPSSPGGITK